MTEYNFSDEQHNDVIKETEETKLERMQVEAKKARERDEGLRIFEGLSHRIQSGETRFDIPPPPPGEGNNSNNNGNGIRKKDRDGRNNPTKEDL